MTTTSVFPPNPKWEGEGTSRIPFWSYTREDLYKKELDKFFYNGHWCYVGMMTKMKHQHNKYFLVHPSLIFNCKARAYPSA